jgi:hypothetical protein
MVETAGLKDSATARDALDADSWARVRALARARLVRSARTRTARPTAARDHALILVLGDMGLRSQRPAPCSSRASPPNAATDYGRG